jgi:hypothetical protein
MLINLAFKKLKTETTIQAIAKTRNKNGGSNNSDVILGRKVYLIELGEFSSLSKTLTNAIKTDFSPLIKDMLAFLKNEDADRHM